jgi:hypothetical protein
MAKRFFKILFALIILLLFVAGGVVAEVYIFKLKKYIICDTTIPGTEFIDQRYLLAILVNMAKMLGLQLYFDRIAIHFNNFENHKTPTDYENSFIFKLFIFAFLNFFTAVFQIAFINKNLDAYGCINDNCFIELQQQIRTVFLILFAKDILIFLLVGLVGAFKRLRLVLASSRDNVWEPINMEMEKQFAKGEYVYQGEISGTTGSYLKVVIQFSFLSLFGLCFPLIFVLAFVINIVQMFIDRFKITRMSKRVIPSGAQSIGVWSSLMDFVSYLSIITNAGLVVYTLGSFDSIPVFWFILLVGINFAVKFVVQELIEDVPAALLTLVERHKYLYKRILRGYGGSAADIKLDDGTFIPKIYGTVPKSAKKATSAQGESMMSFAMSPAPGGNQSKRDPMPQEQQASKGQPTPVVSARPVEQAPFDIKSPHQMIQPDSARQMLNEPQPTTLQPPPQNNNNSMQVMSPAPDQPQLSSRF